MSPGGTAHRFGGVAAALVLASLAVIVPMVSAGSTPRKAATDPPPLTPEQQEVVGQLEETSGSEITIAADESTGSITFLGSEPDRPLAEAGPGPTASAEALLAEVGPALGVDEPGSGLVPTEVNQGLNGSAVRYQQTKNGIPVFGGEVSVQLDDGDRAVSLLADTSPGSPAPPAGAPLIGSADAAEQARQVVADAQGVAPDVLQVAIPEIWYFNPALLDLPGLSVDRLVWRTEVTDQTGAVRELVLVDALSGHVPLHFDQAEEALDRRVCDGGNTGGTLNSCAAPFERVEGDPATGDAAIDVTYDVAGHFYNFFLSRFGRDSIDGAGHQLIATVRYCLFGCPFANAQWQGDQAVFGDGWVADDIVAHEFGHGLTQHQSHLFYYWQSGAMNESFSDIWGELVDLTNGTGTDTPATRWLVSEDRVGGAIRDMADPPARNDPDRVRSPLYHPGPHSADNGGVHTNSGVNNKAAYLMVDGDTFNGVTVSPIGLDKTAAVYYEASESILTSASDYQDLGVALVQACNNLIGTFGITAGDCTEVSDATVATEMHLLPDIPGQQEAAPTCAEGLEPTILFADDFENPAAGRWTATPAGTGTNTAWYYPQTTFGLSVLLDPTYATSGDNNLFGYPGNDSADARMTMTDDVPVPTGDPVYLRFERAYEFVDPADGGVVEYSTDGGGSWNDLGPLFDANGYSGTLPAGPNPLAGREAFVGSTLGYGSSRADLTTLGGSSLRIRFRLGTNTGTILLGWVVDDVSIYQCSEPQQATTTTTTTAPTSTTVGATSSPVATQVTAVVAPGLPQAAAAAAASAARRSPATTGADGLPVSGVESLAMALGALGLVVIGGLFVMARRAAGAEQASRCGRQR